MTFHNPVQVIMLTEEHPEETIRAGRLLDLSGKQFRFIIDDRKLDPGTRYDVDADLVDKNTLWVDQAWKFGWV